MHFLSVLGCVLLFAVNGSAASIGFPSDNVSADSLSRKNVDINNRIAIHFLEKEPNLAFYYADSSATVALEKNYPDGLKTALGIKGKISVMRGDYQQAIMYFDKTRSLAVQLDDTVGVIQGHLDMAGVFLAIKDFDEAESHLIKALNFKGIIHHPSLHANVYTGLWQLYWNKGMIDTVAYFQSKALDIYNIHKDDRKISREIADGFLKVEDFEQALAFYQASLDFQRVNGTKKEVADDLKNIGEIYLTKNNGASALTYFYEAQRIYEKVKNKTALFEVEMDIGRSYFYMHEYDKALKSLNAALKIAKTIDSKSLKARVNKQIAVVYEKYGYFDESIKYYKNYVALKDTLFGEENARKIAELKANLEFEQKEKEIALLIKEKQQLNENAAYKDQINKLTSNLLLILGFSMLLIILLTVLIFYRYRAKKQDNKLLEKQYSEISKQKSILEGQSKIIKDNNMELEKARNTIETKNKALREANEKLETIIGQRTTELKRTYHKLSFHIDNTPLAVLEWNDKMELIRWSSQAEKIFGWKASEVIGCQIQNLPLIKKDHQDSIDKIFAELLTGQKPRNFYKNQNYHKNGSLIDVEWSNSILFNEEGRLESILSIANDVTIREKAIQDLQQSNMELDNFVYRASHDLRGPITRLVGIVNLGMLEAKERIARKYFDILGKVAFEMNAMLSRLLTVHEIYQHDFKSEDIVVKEELKSYVEEFRNKNLTFQINLVYDIPARLKWKTDRVLFKTAMQNLIENAFVNGAAVDPQINIKVRKINGHFVKLTLSDNGVGFSEDVVDKIFNMFFQGTERSNINYGLGLYLTKKSIERLGGSIALTKPVNNTTFEIILPNLQNKTVEQEVLQL
ncbi:PAS domain S-box protein [Fulvivirgaceae bacterium BMA12]|uniref:histidine kinase n=1 Tax=Agaribacillus aureus TaxID=3051825 RepID=A0ABT8LC78_9BACT|nr:PAS domain S-box protein [Fulvivirgaceae bacterium BMA12]